MTADAPSAGNDRPTVAAYVVGRLADLDIHHVFGLPGDYAFPIDDAIQADPRLSWVPATSELNAAYAADGYARAVGAAILCTTYGVGELSALNGVMGSKAERLPVFHLVGAPSSRLFRIGRRLHHTTGSGAFPREFMPLSSAACCVSAVIGPENAVPEMERVIRIALAERRPAYIQISEDEALMPIADPPVKGVPLSDVPPPRSLSTELEGALAAVMARLRAARRPIVLPAFTLSRYGLEDKALAFLEASGLPYAVTTLDKSVLPEAHPQYVGMFSGVAMEAVTHSDCILDLGGLAWDDVSTKFGTAPVDEDLVVHVGETHVELILPGDGEKRSSYGPVWIGDLLDALTAAVKAENYHFERSTGDVAVPAPAPLPEIGADRDPITFQSLASRLQRYLQKDDVLIQDTGSSALFTANILLPEGARYYWQALWASIGWALPAALGFCLGRPSARVICVQGDGAHQVTATELSGAARLHGIRPIFMVINNGMYEIEEILEKNKRAPFNMPAVWQYSKLPETMGAQGWFIRVVATNLELKAALRAARSQEKPSLIEVVVQGGGLEPMASAVVEAAYLLKPKAAPEAVAVADGAEDGQAVDGEDRDGQEKAS